MGASAPPVIDINAKYNVQYCIPNWLRDEQIRLALQRPNVGRIAEFVGTRDKPLAVVGYGPSLEDTWEQARDFSHIISCSGSHRFLIDRGIIPTWHVEVDPRPHKVALLGEPHKDVEYLVSSTCHPDYFDHLSGFNVKLWHVFDASEDGRRLLPHGEWALTGGCDVGLRALTIAAFLGFRDLHVFGLDGCAREQKRHAAFHPNGKQKYCQLEYKGVPYLTTPAMLEAARGTVHELKQMPAVKAKFYGEGLTQRLVEDYTPDTTEAVQTTKNLVGWAKPELISAEYRDLNSQLHLANLAYGVGGGKHADTVLKLAESLKTRSVLDYGCGKGYLAKALPFPIWEYDPAFPTKSEPPRAADLVVCTDVLEHVEPDKLQYVLDDLRRCTRQVGFFVINTGPAQKVLPDGRNTHLIQKDLPWWKQKLKRFFQVARIFRVGAELYVVVAAKPYKKKVVAA